jgi:glycerophosphoryl diester phosphodiesterase
VIGRRRADLTAQFRVPPADFPVVMSLATPTQRAPHVLAHRACLHGPDTARENSRAALAEAIGRGFGVEFDVNWDRGRLTLAHDPEPWSEEIDAEPFLRDPGPGLHALNVKCLDALEELLRLIERAGTARSFFLFDFELLGVGADEMARVQRRGFRVAHRLSEREPHLERYVCDPTVTDVWLDELDWPWLEAEHVHALCAAGKRTFYVSPELHRRQPVQAVARRWDEVLAWGVTGICTDYPIHLRERSTR